MKIVYSDKYEVNLGSHPFRTVKYRLVVENLVKERIIKPSDLLLAQEISEDDLLLVHTSNYIKKVNTLSLSFDELMSLEIPVNEDIIMAAKVCCGGTLLAARIALEKSIGIHIGGGFHHAFSDHGEGFCLFNDIAVAIRKLQSEEKIKSCLIIDCDLHQGNGNASIFSGDEDVFTFSIHEDNIYPQKKEKSSLDIALPSGIDDKYYLSELEKGLKKIFSDRTFDMIMYQAGADPYKGDQLGNLKLTVEGLIKRDRMVKNIARKMKIPVTVMLGGGYSLDPKDTVNIHCNTVKVFMDIL